MDFSTLAFATAVLQPHARLLTLGFQNHAKFQSEFHTSTEVTAGEPVSPPPIDVPT